MSKNKRGQFVEREERSIANFEQTTKALGSVVQGLGEIVNTFGTSISDFQTAQKLKFKEDKEKKEKNESQKKVAKKITEFENIFGKKRMKFLGRMMGTENFNAFKKQISGVGGGSFGKGLMGRTAKKLASGAGSMLRLAGPIGMGFTVGKMIYDFWNSGGLAKMMTGIKMATKKGSMLGPGGLAQMRDSLEGTEAFRKIDAEYAYKKPLELQQQLTQDYFNWEKGNAMDMLSYQQSLVKDDVEYEFGLRRDALQFELDQVKETLDAELERRKAIAASGMSFIKNYANVSERALKAIGSSTKTIIEGLSKFTTTFGLGVKDSYRLTENAQGLAYHLGGSDEDVQSMANLFRLMGKTSAEMAQSLIGGFDSFGRINDISPQAIFAQIKDAGEDIYKFSSGTANNFVKQATLLSKMSVSMSQMMKASDTMVLNYKDSIKAEMSLSAMLGRNVNLSEVRARLMANDQAGAASALKTALGGMDITQMNPFQRQALQQATGMDISALMGLQQSKGGVVSGELKAEAAKGKAFADAALKQDIANAAAKLKLEQEQRKKILEFEQRQRLSMMMLEQTQKLDQIKLEAAYRAQWEFKYAKEFAKNSAAADAMVETATNIFASRGTGSMLGQAFASYGINTNGTTISNISSTISALQQAGYLNPSDMENFTKATNTALQGVKNLKDQKAIDAALQSAVNSSFGGAIAKFNANKQPQIDRMVNIAKAMDDRNRLSGGSDTFENFVKKYNVSQKERIEAAKLLNPGNTLGRGLNQNAISQLINSNLISTNPQNKLIEKSNVSLTRIEGAGQKQLDKQSQTVQLQTQQLSDSEYSVKLQKEMVAMLGLSTQILGKIMENTAGGKDIKLDGKSLRQSLLNQARKDYGVARTA